LDVAKQEIRFAGQTVKAAIRDAARDALINGRWDAIGELLEGKDAVVKTAAKLPYLAA
jgi:3-isopropylmalate/(R)-2-methylmalate dehydratase small subunit